MAETAEELRLELRDKRAAVSRDLEEIGDKVSPKRIADRAGSKVKNAATGVKDKVMGSAEDVADSTSDLAGRATSGMGDIKDRVGDTPDMIRAKTDGNPLAAGLIAFGFGLLAASLLPRSAAEEELVENAEGQLRQVAAAAGDATGAVRSELQKSSQEIVADLRESAAEHARNVKDDATDAAQAVTRHAKDEINQSADATSGDAGPVQAPSQPPYRPPVTPS